MAQPVSSRAPNQWGLDASLFKFTNLTEKVTLRFNVDFFNVLNHPNDPIAVDSRESSRRGTRGAPRA